MSDPRPIYLDNAATTRPADAVVEAMARAQVECFGNPSSPHDFGRVARRALEDARAFLRGTLGAAHLVFTSGGTEADLLGLFGAVRHRSPGRVLAGAADHPAVLAQEDLLAQSHHRPERIAVTATGELDLDDLRNRLTKDVRAIAILHGHNELGALAPLEPIVDAARSTCPDAHLHVVLVQTYGKIPFDLDESGVDSVAVSGHKLHGPRGVGFLALSSKARIDPVQRGGGQEGELRGGTEDVAGAVGLAVAAEAMLSRQSEIAAHCEELGERMFAGLSEVWPQAQRLGPAEHRLPHILSVRVPEIVAETLRDRAASRGLAFSTSSACHGAGDGNVNPVLAAIGFGRKRAREVMRFSFCSANTRDEIDHAVEVLAEEARQMATTAPRR